MKVSTIIVPFILATTVYSASDVSKVVTAKGTISFENPVTYNSNLGTQFRCSKAGPGRALGCDKNIYKDCVDTGCGFYCLRF